MKRIFIDQLKENIEIEDLFLVKEKAIAISRNGKSYLNLRLIDKTGEVEGRVWENADKISQLFKKDDYIKLKARAIIFKKQFQLNITDIKRCNDNEVSPDDFLSMAKQDIEEMFKELMAFSATIKDKYLKELLTLFFKNKEFIRLFKRAPAAKNLHHAYIGGLLEHTLSLCRLVQKVGPLYQGINTDLLLSGGILHDIGKIYELSYKKSFDYTDEGRLLGHITLGVKMVGDNIEKIPGFPPKLAILLKHLILSHHGQYNFGSPKQPKTLEAILLYYFDDMDAKINGVRNFIKQDVANQSSWTGYHSMYERFFYKETYESKKEDDDPQRTLPFTDLLKDNQEK